VATPSEGKPREGGAHYGQGGRWVTAAMFPAVLASSGGGW
jgi:hypothetical protein